MTGPAAAAPLPTIHATAILIGMSGLLIRGPSGSGKSSLAHALVADARAGGRLGCFVADDRVVLMRRGGRLVARAPGTLAGLAELHGWGILPVEHEPAALVTLVVDLVAPEAVARMPEPRSTEVVIDGVPLPRQAVPMRSIGPASRLVAAALAAAEGRIGPRAAGRPFHFAS